MCVTTINHHVCEDWEAGLMTDTKFLFMLSPSQFFVVTEHCEADWIPCISLLISDVELSMYSGKLHKTLCKVMLSANALTLTNYELTSEKTQTKQVHSNIKATLTVFFHSCTVVHYEFAQGQNTHRVRPKGHPSLS